MNYFFSLVASFFCCLSGVCSASSFNETKVEHACYSEKFVHLGFLRGTIQSFLPNLSTFFGKTTVQTLGDSNKKNMSQDFDEKTFVSLAVLKDHASVQPVVIFESEDRTQGFSFVPEVERCRSFLCPTLSKLFPSYFSERLAKIEPYNNVEELRHDKNKKLEVVRSWRVDDFYAKQAITHLEDNCRVKYGYKEDLVDPRSWYGLKKLTTEELSRNKSTTLGFLLGGYCNFGNFHGHTNGAIYMLNVLDNFCNIPQLNKDFLTATGTANERLILAVKKSRVNH